MPLPWLGDTTYRMHRFRSTASPIKGLTSDILVRRFSRSLRDHPRIERLYFQTRAAEVAYGKNTTYERYSPNQLIGIDPILRLLAMAATDDSRKQNATCVYNGTHLDA